MKSNVDDAVRFIQKFNLSSKPIILKYNSTKTMAKVVFQDANIQLSNFMKVENAIKFMDNIKIRLADKG
jgi:hypothetical protein